jgi:2-dehydro-3-deoxyglucarate aldolase/4-hydroxy-2-oxoheptanedioate aldolase
MGMLGQVSSAEVQESIARVQLSCSQAGLPTGIFCPDVESARAQMRLGFTLIALGMDSRFLVDSIRRALKKLR